MRKERREINDQLLDDLWSFLCDCEKAGDRTRHTALTEASQAHGEGAYRMARDVKERMVILGYKPSSNDLTVSQGVVGEFVTREYREPSSVTGSDQELREAFTEFDVFRMKYQHLAELERLFEAWVHVLPIG